MVLFPFGDFSRPPSDPRAPVSSRFYGPIDYTLDYPEQQYEQSQSFRDPATGEVVFASPGAGGPLDGRFANGPGGDLSIAIRVGGIEVASGGVYPGRLNGRLPERLGASAPAAAAGFQPGPAADFATGAVRAVYAEGIEVQHSRKILFKQRDYWVVVDRMVLASGTGGGEPTLGCAIELPGAARIIEPTALRTVAGDDPDGARLAVYPVMQPGLTGQIEAAGDSQTGSVRSRLVLERTSAGPVHFITLLHPVPPGEEPQIDVVEGIEAEGALAVRIFFGDGWVHTFVDKGENPDQLLLNFLPILAEITLLEITPLGDLSRRIEVGGSG